MMIRWNKSLFYLVVSMMFLCFSFPILFGKEMQTQCERQAARLCCHCASVREGVMAMCLMFTTDKRVVCAKSGQGYSGNFPVDKYSL